VRSLDDLCEKGLIAASTATLEELARRYPVRVTRTLVELIDKNDPADPIACQFVPSEAEAVEGPGEEADPIGDAAHSPLPGLIHRYPDRVLLTVTNACAAYCRFCFRRTRVGHGEGLSGQALARVLDYIRAHGEVREVILSGGDPLMLSPRRLGALLDEIEAIDHVKVLRIHSRVPVVDPARMTAEMLDALTRAKPLYLLLHANHARELTPEARALCLALVRRGVVLLSQSVLLRGVNDTPESLEALLRALVESRIKPHYLHLLDHAPGTAHFRVSIEEARALLKPLQNTLSGLAQPTLMLDIPGGHGKIPIGPTFIERDGETWQVEGMDRTKRAYKE